jgi:DNA-binding winged helix-turn-helix (wHTH) protein
MQVVIWNELKLLKLLVARPREVIAREEIARRLWDAGVFVDFEQDGTGNRRG